MSCWKSSLSLAVLISWIGISSAKGQQLSITDTAATICNTVKDKEVRGTSRKVEIEGVLGKLLAAIGIKLSQEQFEGLSRDADAAALAGDRECRKHVFDKMYDKLTELNNTALIFYRRLNQNLTQLDSSLRVVALPGQTNQESLVPFSRQIRRMQSDAKPVCEARPRLAELGDTAILEQLDTVCRLLDVGFDHAEMSGGLAARFAAAAVTQPILAQQGMMEKLRNEVALKVRSVESRLK